MSTTISVSDEVANELSERKEQDDSHNDVIQRLLDDRQTPTSPIGTRSRTPASVAR
jgi:Uncharacterized ACR, COG1753.